MISLFNLNKDSKIFEIGCNDGHMLADLKKNGFKNISGIEAPFHKKILRL